MSNIFNIIVVRRTVHNFSLYRSIKDFDYDHPKWTQDNGCFIQQVYSKVKSSGFGTASYNDKLFMVGLYDYEILTSDPMDSAHVPKPAWSESMQLLSVCRRGFKTTSNKNVG